MLVLDKIFLATVRVYNCSTRSHDFVTKCHICYPSSFLCYGLPTFLFHPIMLQMSCHPYVGFFMVSIVLLYIFRMSFCCAPVGVFSQTITTLVLFIRLRALITISVIAS